MSRHASHHVLSSCLINGAYLATGHADSTLRVWQLNPLYFDTPFSSVAQKKISNEEIMMSGIGAASSANFKKKDALELKSDPVVLPFELEFSSNEEFHKHYVTSLAFVYRKAQNEMMLVSGDAGGELVISEFNYNTSTRKVDPLQILFRKRAHKGQIIKLDMFSHDDVFVSAGTDGLIIFWDISTRTKLMEMQEHDDPINSIAFTDNYSTMVSSSKSSIIIWKVSLQENARYQEEKENDNPNSASKKMLDEDKGPRFVLEVKIMKVLSVEEKGHIGSQTRLFSTNLKHDYLVFAGVNSDIKILNTRNGKYIGEIDGAHFKGTYNFGLIVSPALAGKLADMYQSYEEEKTPEKLMDIIVEQLNHIMMVTVSVKDKMKLWKFEDGLSSPIAQASCIGGLQDSGLLVLTNTAKEACVISMGNASNKAEIFRLKHVVEEKKKD